MLELALTPPNMIVIEGRTRILLQICFLFCEADVSMFHIIRSSGAELSRTSEEPRMPREELTVHEQPQRTIKRRNAFVVHLLVHDSIDTALQDPNMLKACRAGSYELVRFLLRTKGATVVNETDEIGHAPLETAITAGHTRIAKLLIKRGADVSYSRPYDGATPLHSALIHERYDIVKLLLSRGDSYGYHTTINQAAHNGFTPLHIACSNGNAEIVYLLLQKGAPVEACDARGWTPLFVASWRGHVHVVMHLLAFGANASARDIDGQTPFSLLECRQASLDEVLVSVLEHGGAGPEKFDKAKHLGIVKTLSMAFKCTVKKYLSPLASAGVPVVESTMYSSRGGDSLSETRYLLKQCSSVLTVRGNPSS